MMGVLDRDRSLRWTGRTDALVLMCSTRVVTSTLLLLLLLVH
jgi:hypothetical protein